MTVQRTYQGQVQINKLDVEKTEKKCIHNTEEKTIMLYV
jgi:hypothetical protein